MEIQLLEVENFKSFKKLNVIRFDKLKNGLWFVTGENMVDQEMGANGAGKSAMFEAICWCLYGKTSTNLKAGNIVNWGEKFCRVDVYFNDFVVIRTQNPNSIIISDPAAGTGKNETVVTQEELENRIGMGFESFLYSTFISQFSSKFFDLSPADKMVVFSDIMSETLQPWLDRSNTAKVRANDQIEGLHIFEKAEATSNGELNQLNSTNYKAEARGFELERKREIERLTKEIADISKKRDENKNSVESLKNKILELQKELSEAERVDYTEEKALLKDSIVKLQKEVSYHLAEVRTLEKSHKKIVETQGFSLCPVCMQTVDRKLLEKELKKIEKSINENNKIALELDEKREQESDKLADYTTAENQLNEKRSEIATEMRVTQTMLDGKLMEGKRHIKDIESIKLSIIKENGKENPFLDMERKRLERIKIVKKDIKRAQEEIAIIKKDYDAYVYWIKGFKEIRLLLMIDALKELEVSINNSLSRFGMGGWNVKLDIDKETKSGTVRKGFSVLVESPDHSGHVPFEVWSGGEGQRLRLAGSIGLMDLIQSRKQTNLGIEIFDEPTAWLSENGIDDLLQILYDRAEELDKKIFIIDHKNLRTFGGFSGIINVTKTDEGSQINVN